MIDISVKELLLLKKQNAKLGKKKKVRGTGSCM